MPTDKSHNSYGALYHRLFDDKLVEMHQIVLELVPDGAAVRDIGCGTGLLCAEWATRKSCRVTPIDLSLKMLSFAC